MGKCCLAMNMGVPRGSFFMMLNFRDQGLGQKRARLTAKASGLIDGN